eukprot:TRINITY_DN5608_c0_g1_i1.p1 TRINITY_DN5608_c0_g1~~TRINITY_DN5608_c0_g1_i1.p1  ORF type:complete len:338 (+),score=7.14 TRINITY_DN5608_c0_g1_i1:142-1014(+)
MATQKTQKKNTAHTHTHTPQREIEQKIRYDSQREGKRKLRSTHTHTHTRTHTHTLTHLHVRPYAKALPILLSPIATTPVGRSGALLRLHANECGHPLSPPVRQSGRVRIAHEMKLCQRHSVSRHQAVPLFCATLTELKHTRRTTHSVLSLFFWSQFLCFVFLSLSLCSLSPLPFRPQHRNTHATEEEARKKKSKTKQKNTEKKEDLSRTVVFSFFCSRNVSAKTKRERKTKVHFPERTGVAKRTNKHKQTHENEKTWEAPAGDLTHTHTHTQPHDSPQASFVTVEIEHER